MKFKLIVNTKLKFLAPLIWRLPSVVLVKVRSIDQGITGRCYADKQTTRYLNLDEFDQIFRVLFNILPLLKVEKIIELRASANLADSTDLGEGLCVICMERQSDLVLSCLVSSIQHSFCSDCIGNWSVKDQSCPMCRMTIQQSQGFLMLNSGQIDYQESLREAAREITGVISGSRSRL